MCGLFFIYKYLIPFLFFFFCAFRLVTSSHFSQLKVFHIGLSPPKTLILYLMFPKNQRAFTEGVRNLAGIQRFSNFSIILYAFLWRWEAKKEDLTLNFKTEMGKKWSVYSKANDNYGYLPQWKNGHNKKIPRIWRIFSLLLHKKVRFVFLEVDERNSADHMCHLLYGWHRLLFVPHWFSHSLAWHLFIIANNISFIN